jgi:hypothetical protein
MTQTNRPTAGEIAYLAYETAHAAWQAAHVAHEAYMKALDAVIPNEGTVTFSPHPTERPTVPAAFTEDRVRMVLVCLPEVLRTVQPIDGEWYSAKAVRAVVHTLLEPRRRRAYMAGDLFRALRRLGFTEHRSRGMHAYYRLTPEMIQVAQLQHRVSPTEAVAASIVFRELASYAAVSGGVS